MRYSATTNLFSLAVMHCNAIFHQMQGDVRLTSMLIAYCIYIIISICMLRCCAFSSFVFVCGGRLQNCVLTKTETLFSAVAAMSLLRAAALKAVRANFTEKGAINVRHKHTHEHMLLHGMWIYSMYAHNYTRIL